MTRLEISVHTSSQPKDIVSTLASLVYGSMFACFRLGLKSREVAAVFFMLSQKFWAFLYCHGAHYLQVQCFFCASEMISDDGEMHMALVQGHGGYSATTLTEYKTLGHHHTLQLDMVYCCPTSSLLRQCTTCRLIEVSIGDLRSEAIQKCLSLARMGRQTFLNEINSASDMNCKFFYLAAKMPMARQKLHSKHIQWTI